MSSSSAAPKSAPAAGREWGDNEANRSVRVALNKDLDALATLYANRSKQLYAQMEAGITSAPPIGCRSSARSPIMLAGVGVLVIWRGCIKPLADITHVTEEVADGHDVAIPHRDRKDEIGALAGSIAVFQKAMTSNGELTKTVSQDAEARAKRQEIVTQEISRFSADVETSLSELLVLVGRRASGFATYRRGRVDNVRSDGARGHGVVGGVRQCERHRFGGGRVDRRRCMRSNGRSRNRTASP